MAQPRLASSLFLAVGVCAQILELPFVRDESISDPALWTCWVRAVSSLSWLHSTSCGANPSARGRAHATDSIRLSGDVLPTVVTRGSDLFLALPDCRVPCTLLQPLHPMVQPTHPTFLSVGSDDPHWYLPSCGFTSSAPRRVRAGLLLLAAGAWPFVSAALGAASLGSGASSLPWWLPCVSSHAWAT